MEAFGWIVLVAFALMGVALAGYLLFSFCAVEFSIFKAQLAQNRELRKENVKIRGELKRARLARMREAKDNLANNMIDVKIATAQDKHNSKYGGGQKAGNQENKKESRKEIQVEAPVEFKVVEVQ